jgi:hypothetical protein
MFRISISEETNKRKVEAEMSIQTREPKEKLLKGLFVEAKCNKCKTWDTYSPNQVPVFTNHKGSVVICYDCK